MQHIFKIISDCFSGDLYKYIYSLIHLSNGNIDRTTREIAGKLISENYLIPFSFGEQIL